MVKVRLCLFLSVLSLPLCVHSTSYTWNVTGSGLWDNAPSATNWNTGTFPDSTSDTATFNGVITSSSTVTVDGSFTVDALIFDNGTYAFTIAPDSSIGSGLLLGGGVSSTNLIVTAGTHTITSPMALIGNVVFQPAASTGVVVGGGITGAFGITSVGAGAVYLNGNGITTYSGATTLSSGTWTAQSINAFSPNSALTVSGTGILDLYNYNNTVPSLSSGGDTGSEITSSSGSGLLTINGSSMTTFEGVVTGYAGLYIDGGANLTLTNTGNNYSGPTTVNNGVLTNTGDISNDAAIMTVNSSGTFNNTGGDIHANQLILNGGVLNNTDDSHWYGSGTTPTITVTSGTLTNGTLGDTSDLSELGDSSTAISFTGGSIVNSGYINASTYTQGAGAALTLAFPNSADLGTIYAAGDVNLAGTLTINYQNSGSLTGVHQLITAGTGDLTGSFVSPITYLNFGDSDPRVSYSLTDVSLYFSTCNNTWTYDAESSQDWGSTDNWGGGCIPGAPGFSNDVANFGNVDQSSMTVTLADPTGLIAYPVTLYQMNFDSTETSYTIEQLSSASIITMEATPSGTPQINVINGSHEIDAPMILNNNIEVILGNGSTFTFGSNTVLSSSSEGVGLSMYAGNTAGGTVNNNGMLTLSGVYEDVGLYIENITVNNSGPNAAIQLTGPETELLIDGTETRETTIVNSGSNAVIGTSGSGSYVGIIAYDTSTITVTNSGTGALIGATGPDSEMEVYPDEVGSTVTLTNEGKGSQIGTTGPNSSFYIRGDAETSMQVYNYGEFDEESYTGAFVGSSGTGGYFEIDGTLESLQVYNEDLSAVMGSTGLAGSVTVYGGAIQNLYGAAFVAGPGGYFYIDGGSIFNDSVSTVGASTADMYFDGGVLETQGNVLALSYYQYDTSVLQLDLTSPYAVGNVAASKRASVGGSLIVNAAGYTPAAGEVMDLVTASGGGCSGTYGSSVQFLNFQTGVIPAILYTPDAVQLTLASTVTSSSLGSIPQLSFIAVNETNIRLGRQVHSMHGRLMKMNGKKNTQTAASDVASSDELLASNGPAQIKQRKTSQLAERMVREEGNPSRFYFGPIDSFGAVNSRGVSQTGFGYNSVGFFTGIDHAFSDWGGGLAAEYSGTNARVVHHAGHFNAQQVHGSAYATVLPSSLSELSIDAIVGGGYAWYKMHRNAGPTVMPVTALGKTNGWEADALLGVEYVFTHEKFASMPNHAHAMPYFNIQYVWDHVDGYQETRAGVYDLNATHQNLSSLRSCLGLRFDYMVETKNFTFKPEFNLAWQLEYLDHSRNVQFTTVSAPNFQSIPSTIQGAGRNTLLGGVDFFMTVCQAFEIEVSYDIQFNSLYLNNSFYLGVGGNF